MSGEIEVHRGLCTQLMLLILHANLRHSYQDPFHAALLGPILVSIWVANYLSYKSFWSLAQVWVPGTRRSTSSCQHICKFDSQEASPLSFIPSFFLLQIAAIALQALLGY